MYRRSCLRIAPEFKQKSRWSQVWPSMHYGAMFLPYTSGRQIPLSGVNWVTRDSNRLVNFRQRYGSVLADIDVKRTEEELKVQLDDIRWNDHRRIYWRCSFCGHCYRKSVSVRTKFHAGCNYCKKRYPSEVLGGQAVSEPLRTHDAALVSQLADKDKADNIAGLSCSSKFDAEWKCQRCGAPYRATIRGRTGCVEPGQAPLHPQITQWTAYCPSCRWSVNMRPLGTQAMKDGQYLGLELAQSPEASAKHDKPIPRRRKLVA